MANTVPKESKVVYLQIGQNYEHLAENKQFDVSEWVEAYPDATIYILFRRPGEDVVAPVQTTLEDGILTWTISNWETGIIGVGFAEIRAIDSTTGLVKKSHVIPCSVEASVTNEDTAPDFPSWIDRMITMNEHLESVYADFNQELADGITAIQDEAAEQKADVVAAIQSKGDTVIASIPMSYTDLIEALAGAAYNPNRHYEHDEFVWYDNHLWRRRTDSPSIVGPWNEDDWIRAALTAHVTEALWQVESMQNELYNSIAPAWDYYDTTASYAVGDYVINRERLYRCISPVSGGGDFDYSKWEVVTVAAELQKYVKSGAIASDYSASTTYKAGQYVWYSGNVYRCKTDISTAEAWTAAHWQLVKIGDELTNLKSALTDVFSQSLDGTFTSSGNKWFAFNFVIGKTYKFKNTSSGNYGMTANTVKSSGSYSYVEQIGSGTIGKGATVTFVPTVDAPYMVVYCNGAGTFTITCVDTIAKLKSDIATNTSDIETNTSNIATLSTTVADNKTETDTKIDNIYTHEAEKSYDAAGIKWLKFDIRAGGTYLFSVSGSNITAAHTTETTDYNYIDDIGTISPGQTKIFTAEHDAKYINAYMAGAGSYTVKELNTIDEIYKNQSENSEKIKNNFIALSEEMFAIPSGAQLVDFLLLWERGGLNMNNGYEIDNKYSIRSFPYKCGADMDIIITAQNSNNSVVLFKYQADGTFVGTSSATTSGTKRTLNKGYIYRMFVYGTSTYPTDPNNATNVVKMQFVNPLYNGIPDYYNTYLPTKIDEIEAASQYIRGVTFPFITDVHLQSNAMNSAALIKYISEKTNAVPFVLFGGDVPKAVDTAENVIAYAKQWTEYIGIWGREKTVQVHGNHDYMCALDNTLTNLWFAPLSECFEYIQQNEYFLMRHPVSALYGCIDIPNQKVKIIIADNFDGSYDIADDSWSGALGMSVAQLKWIANEVLNNSDGYDVIFATHVPTVSALSSEYSALEAYDNLIKAAGNHTTYTVDGTTYDFSAWTGVVVCELSGHVHKDGSATDAGVLYIGTTCDCYVDSDPNVTRTKGTTSEQAFDIVCVDVTNKTIKMVRIGGGVSRTFNYDNTSETFGEIK